MVGFILYKLSPSIRKQFIHRIEQIPKKWDSIIDSGSTKYFNPLFYKISFGQYRRAVNSSIGMDQYGLPDVDDSIPLVSFNMEIYKRYYKVFNEIFNDVKTVAQSAPENQLAEYRVESKINDFYDIIREQLRIDVIGKTCMIVKTWDKGHLLIHKSNYLSFLQDHRAKSGWKSYTNQSLNNARYRIAKLSGLRWLFESVMRPTTIIRSNLMLYGSIRDELWALSRKWPNSIHLAFLAFYDFTHDSKNELSYAYLENAYSKAMILTAILRKLNILVSRTNRYLDTDTNSDIDSFYRYLTNPTDSNSIIRFTDVIKSITPNPDLVAVNTILKRIEEDNPDVIIREFKSNLDRITTGIEADDIEIYKLLPYIKDPTLTNSIKAHNKSARKRQGVIKTLIDHHKKFKVDASHITQNDIIVDRMDFNLNALTDTVTKTGINMAGRSSKRTSTIFQINTELINLRGHIVKMDRELNDAGLDYQTRQSKEDEQEITLKRIEELEKLLHIIMNNKEKDKEIKLMKEALIMLNGEALKGGTNPQIARRIKETTQEIANREIKLQERVQEVIEKSEHLYLGPDTSDLMTSDQLNQVNLTIESASQPATQSVTQKLFAQIGSAAQIKNNFKEAHVQMTVMAAKINELERAASIENPNPSNEREPRATRYIINQLNEQREESLRLKTQLQEHKELLLNTQNQSISVNQQNKSDMETIAQLANRISKLTNDNLDHRHEISQLTQEKNNIYEIIAERNQRIDESNDKVVSLTNKLKLTNIEVGAQIENVQTYKNKLRQSVLSGNVKSYVNKLVLNSTQQKRSRLATELMKSSKNKLLIENELSKARKEASAAAWEIVEARAQLEQEKIAIARKTEEIQSLKDESQKAQLYFKQEMQHVDRETQRQAIAYVEQAKLLTDTLSKKSELEIVKQNLDTKVESLSGHVDTLESKMKVVSEEIIEAQNKLGQNIQERQLLQSKLQESEKTNSELSEVSAYQMNEIQNLKRQIESLKSASGQNIDKLSDTLSNLSKEKETVTKEKNQLIEQIVLKTETINKLENDIISLNKRHTDHIIDNQNVYRDQMSQLKKSHEESYNTKVGELEKNQQAAYDAKVGELESSHKHTLEQNRQQYNESIQMLESDHQSALEQNRRNYELEVSKIQNSQKSDHSLEYDKLKLIYENNIEKLQKALDDRFNAKENEYVQEVERITNESNRKNQMLQQQFDTLSQKFNETKGADEGRIQTLTAEVQELKKQREDMERYKEQISNVEQDLSNKVSELKSQIQTMEEDYKQKESGFLDQIAELSATNTGLSNELTDVKKQLAIKDAESNDLNNRINQLQTSYSTTKSAYQQQTLSLDAATTEITKKSREITILQNMCANVDSKLKALQAEVAARSAAESKSAAAESGSAEKLIETANRLALAETALERQNSEVANSQKQIKELNSASSKLLNEKQGLEARVSELQKKIDNQNQTIEARLKVALEEQAATIQTINNDHKHAMNETNQTCTQLGAALSRFTLKDYPLIICGVKVPLTVELLEELSNFDSKITDKSPIGPAMLSIINAKQNPCQIPYKGDCRIFSTERGKILILSLAAYDTLATSPMKKLKEAVSNCGIDLTKPVQFERFNKDYPELGVAYRFFQIARLFFHPHNPDDPQASTHVGNYVFIGANNSLSEYLDVEKSEHVKELIIDIKKKLRDLIKKQTLSTNSSKTQAPAKSSKSKRREDTNQRVDRRVSLELVKRDDSNQPQDSKQSQDLLEMFMNSITHLSTYKVIDRITNYPGVSMEKVNEKDLNAIKNLLKANSFMNRLSGPVVDGLQYMVPYMEKLKHTRQSGYNDEDNVKLRNTLASIWDRVGIDTDSYQKW